MITKKENKDLQDSRRVSDDRNKDRKYSDTGRDGDYSTELPTSIEEGDEDYDDETEQNDDSRTRQ